MSMGSNNAKEEMEDFKDSADDVPKFELLPLYIPFESLTEAVIRSIISVVDDCTDFSPDFSQRTLLIYLLEINKKVKDIEASVTTTTDDKPDENKVQQAKNIREWLVDKDKKPLDWEKLEKTIDFMTTQSRTVLMYYLGMVDQKPYYELRIPTVS